MSSKQESLAEGTIKDKHPETHGFEVDVNQMMDTMIKSVYSSKELFLRELVSNSSDACDKLKSLYYELNSKGCDLDPVTSLSIEIIPNKTNRTLTIKDNGIGMTKPDLMNFIGTIASSGTKKFREEMKEKGNAADASNLIGQFGLGFYSSYLVADRVDVITKHPEDEALVWTSTGRDVYTIEEYTGDSFSHGTSLVLYIKEGEEEFLDPKKISEIVKKYSLFVFYPIYTYVEKEIEEPSEEKEEEKEEKATEETTEPKVEEAKEKRLKKVTQREQINAEKPLWKRNIKEVPEEELKSFYKTISEDWDDFLAVDFWRVEGLLSIDLLMFIPKRARFDMFNRNKKNNNIKLYCKNVFVTDDFGDSIPEWMSFVSGVIASDDIPMNISREMIQGTNVMKLVKKILPQKIFEMIGKLAMDAEKYKTFYKEFGNCIKMAIGEASEGQQDGYAKCLRYFTTKSGEEMVSLDTYVERMAANQKQIYVITGLGKDQVKSNPALDAFQKYEVIYMYDVMDEVMLRGLKKYKGHAIQRITSEGVELPEDEENNEEIVKSFEEFCKKAKDLLSNKVEKVTVNPRLVSAPAVISTTKYSLSGTMENIMRSQPVTEANPFAAMTAVSKKIFEMNPHHKLVKNLKTLFDNNEIEKMGKMLELFFETVLIHNGFMLSDPKTFCANVFEFLCSSEVKSEELVEEVQ
ncbi:Hsp90-like protein [Encephalitozoon intestinalis ATCC 50506]|uniref:Hsp90-like protein n=1 Tax=Encephalitozoon intestinalis (strain ATCC 50506) TaxID=876142 RepID=E0S5W8_ENCIT|nr:Hsp90-like protein [Encephalitozoon intestinalis ATCC 50506]ADM11103.1 Hsp90-like protein [Encephalitozoon intestinalis ATCC 50506]UTX44757.1 heat shock protein 90 [Encephalitozoon intestinalis]